MSGGQQEITVTNPPSWYSAGAVSTIASPDDESAVEFRSRQARLRNVFAANGVDAVVTVKQANLRYLTGYSTVAPGKAALVVTRDSALLAVSESELGRAVAAAPAIDGVHVFGWDEPVDIDRWLRESEATRDCRAIVREWDSSTDHGELIDRTRLITSDWGASRMRLAALATKKGIEAALAEARRADATDADMAASAVSAMVRESGYEFPSFLVVGIDEGGSLAHSPWRRHVLRPGGVAFLEFSGGFDGYCAPVMRTIAREPVSDDVLFLFDRVEAILGTLYQEIRPGAKCSDIAAMCTATLGTIEGVLFHYNYGYPVNIFDDQSRACSWMSGPVFYITADNDGVLEAGMTFHLPIVLRRFGQYAVGQSQTVRVTDDGVEILTDKTPAGLLRVPR